MPVSSKSLNVKEFGRLHAKQGFSKACGNCKQLSPWVETSLVYQYLGLMKKPVPGFCCSRRARRAIGGLHGPDQQKLQKPVQ